ncbi:hypothetical protein RIF29_39254 [Crotalaria pallida]|uniref:Cyclin C-terminal domain-containing protein n=1 Tax=Crotalaria pallida TaxID=3830 RepID=A0AAN9E745_CROPI
MPNAEAVSYYFQVEHHFVPAKNFYSDPTNLRIRKLAVSSIAKVLDVSLTAICCLTIAAKKRTKSFSLTSFMEGRFVDIKVEILMKIEHLILSALDDIKPVTPFCFLDHFYPQFKSIGGFKRHCINEIIVQAQGEDKFMEYKPSEIALASFLAATHIAYPSRIIASIPIPEGLTNCYRGLVDLCHNKGIKIVRAKLETPSPSSANETETETETESDKQGQATGKEEDTKLHVSTSETIES